MTDRIFSNADGELFMRIAGAGYAIPIASVTDGIAVPDAVPDQSGHAGEFLTTDGTDIAWAATVAPVIVTFPFYKDSVDTSSGATMFTADRPYRVVSASEVHAARVTDSGGASFDIRKCTGTQSASSGSTVLGSTFDLTGTANTVVTATLTDTAANLLLDTGDRLMARVGVSIGTDGLVGGVVTVALEPA